MELLNEYINDNKLKISLYERELIKKYGDDIKNIQLKVGIRRGGYAGGFNRYIPSKCIITIQNNQLLFNFDYEFKCGLAELLDIESDQYTVSARKMLIGGIFMGKDVEINGIKNIQETLIRELTPLLAGVKVPVSVELFNEIFLSKSFELFLAKKYSNPLNKKREVNPFYRKTPYGHIKNEKGEQLGWQAHLTRNQPKYIEIQIYTDNYPKINFHEFMGINEENIEEYDIKVKGEYISYDFLKKIKKDVLTKFFLLKQK